MRTIKFRAWDKNTKQMYPEIYFKDFAHKDETIVHEQGLNEAVKIASRVYELMQFTGLLDKNGKEIYEGDILKFKDEANSFFEDSKTVYREVKWQTRYGAGWDFGAHHKDGEKRWSYPFWSEMEVIGNIYENPDLIIN